MRFSAADFRQLQASGLVAVSMIAVGVAALYVSYQARESAELTRLAVVAQRNEANAKLKQVRAEESEIKQKSILFNQLQERGLIGE